jgi:hypothetical protein
VLVLVLVLVGRGGGRTQACTRGLWRS